MNFDTSNSEFNSNLEKIKTSDRVHADVYNTRLEKLIKNDVFLNGKLNEASSKALEVSSEVRQARGSRSSLNDRLNNIKNEIPLASSSTNGLMSSYDKGKIESGVEALNEVRQARGSRSSLNDRLNNIKNEIPLASSSTNGLMSSSEKTKIDRVVIRGGVDNTGFGYGAIDYNDTGRYNTAIGNAASNSNKVGNNNSAFGYGTLLLSKGGENSAFGSRALFSLSSGSNNTAIGYNAGANLSSANNTIFLGNSSVTSLRCNVTSITSLSDKRTKKDIVPANLDICLNNVKNLPLHHFAYEDWASKRADKHGLGWIAQEVEKVFPKSVITEERTFNKLDENGNPLKIKTLVTETNEQGNELEVEKEIEETFKIEDCKSFTPTEILPTLWGAMQKLISIVENQQEQIDILKNEVELLKIK